MALSGANVSKAPLALQIARLVMQSNVQTVSKDVFYFNSVKLYLTIIITIIIIIIITSAMSTRTGYLPVSTKHCSHAELSSDITEKVDNIAVCVPVAVVQNSTIQKNDRVNIQKTHNECKYPAIPVNAFVLKYSQTICYHNAG